MNTLFHTVSLVALFAPLSAAAQINQVVLKQHSTGIIEIINGVFVPVIFAVAFIVFFWGVYKYFILGASSESDKGEGRTFVMWGIVGFVIILSVWGLVGVVRNTLGLTTENAPKPPTFDTSSGSDNYNSGTWF